MCAVNLLLSNLGYSVKGTIGEGAYAKVKIATSVKYQRDVAIKVLDRKRAPENYFKMLLTRELSILRTIHHPNIITAYEFINLSNGLFFIVMELCFTDLMKVLQNAGRLTEDKAKCIFQQMISAVNFLHDHHVVHRDLKCENILLMENLCVKIADFSFGKVLATTDLSQTYCGSPAYAAPEILQGIPYDPKKSDIWSLGVILYFMVTGTKPFDASNIRMLPKLQKQGVRFPEYLALNEKCKCLIKTLLEYSPHDRPDICTIVKHSWL